MNYKTETKIHRGTACRGLLFVRKLQQPRVSITEIEGDAKYLYQ
jgi:hypothetical protein